MMTAAVPCGECRACCGADLIALMPEMGDDLASYDHDVIHTPAGEIPYVKKGIDGNCIYLGAIGCTIHERAPVICKTFDCRRFFLSKTRNERRNLLKIGVASADVIRAGRERVGTL